MQKTVVTEEMNSATFFLLQWWSLAALRCPFSLTSPCTAWRSSLAASSESSQALHSKESPSSTRLLHNNHSFLFPLTTKKPQPQPQPQLQFRFSLDFPPNPGLCLRGF